MYYILFIVVGLCLGSFVNALVWRVREQSKHSKPAKDLSIVHGRSMCSHCHHPLAAADLIPLFSWLYLRGKCRYCRKPIADNPLVEVITPILFVFSYHFWPFMLAGGGWLLFGVWLAVVTLFMALAVYDVRWMELPDRLVLILVLISIAVLVIEPSVSKESLIARSIDALWGVGVLFGLFYGIFQLSKGQWIGGGDVKLAVAIGLLVGGPVEVLLVLFLASCIGTLIGLPILLTAKQRSGIRIPFGPLLILSTYLVYLFSERVIDWYESTLFII